MAQYHFSDYIYTSLNHTLYNTETDTEFSLKPKTAQLLNFFLENDKRCFSKAEIKAAVWPNSVVEDASLYLQVKLLREAIGAEAIQTKEKVGYAFSYTVEVKPSEQGTPTSRLWLCSLIVCFSVLLLWNYSKLQSHESPVPNPPLTKNVLLSFSKIQKLDFDANEKLIVMNGRRDTKTGFSLYWKRNNLGEDEKLLLDAGEGSLHQPKLIGDDVYFISVHREEGCLVKVGQLSISESRLINIQTLANCGIWQKIGSLAVTRDKETVFFTRINEPGKPGEIYKLNLKTNKEYKLTHLMPDILVDYDFSLSDDKKMLAILRLNSEFQTQVILYKVDTGESEIIDEFDSIISDVVWAKGKIYLAYEKTIYQLEFPSKRRTKKYASGANLYSIKPLIDNLGTTSFMYTAGQLVKTDMVQYFPKTNEIKPWMSSAKNDVTLSCKEKNSCFFASDKTGIYQLYKLNGDGTNELISDQSENNFFNQIVPISNFELVILSENNLFIYDIKERTFSPLLVGQRINSITSSCSTGSVLVSIKEAETASLYRLSLVDESLELLSTEAEQIKSDCFSGTPSVYFTRSNEQVLYRSDINEFKPSIRISDFRIQQIRYYDVGNEKVVWVDYESRIHYFDGKGIATHQLLVDPYAVYMGEEGRIYLSIFESGEVQLQLIQ
ncbi:helix-turn-helix domain-containing protein [Catenovulum sp. SM1970]|uniref:winged helix-turn-helix domain-containing protein n=1 Tax=Marinifaba aquimaris TaxID=2741323 RepID=UPI0015719122|nr:helix-turn-helix domain-containing protein [Marinifaba aquimaris]NTS77477.1 helix-turn-helix domain-containing protein [Marinifaba aquimaris]